MSREVYAPPTLGTPSANAAGGASGSLYTSIDQVGPLTQYLCGECNAKVQLKKGDPIRCKECGHRVLYKERTKRMVQFEAR
ncbi:DNA-directed RNA polymerase core subunit rpc10 [Xylographa pallens]|nr:DNA-directed RNA polymerase core subunit rpc10 [Xylographa pallens]